MILKILRKKIKNATYWYKSNTLVLNQTTENFHNYQVKGYNIALGGVYKFKPIMLQFSSKMQKHIFQR